MKGMYRVALMAALVAVSATSVQAMQAPAAEDESNTEVYVMNNHLTDVRVFAEDAEGQLHALGQVRRGEVKTFDVSEAMCSGQFRIKVYPTSPIQSPIPDDYGIKTNPFDFETDRQVRIWLEVDLTQSIVEIARG